MACHPLVNRNQANSTMRLLHLILDFAMCSKMDINEVRMGLPRSVIIFGRPFDFSEMVCAANFVEVSTLGRLR
jgi:hypothetical protein